MRASIFASSRHSASVQSQPAPVRDALPESAERRHDDRQAGSPCLRQREAESLRPRRWKCDEPHAIVCEESGKLARHVAAMNREHAIVALPRPVLDIHVADQHEAHVLAPTRTSAVIRSRRRAPLSGPTAPSTATVGTPSSGSDARTDAAPIARHAQLASACRLHRPFCEGPSPARRMRDVRYDRHGCSGK